MNAPEFFATLYDGADEYSYSYIWTLPDKATREAPATDSAALASLAAEADGRGLNVYYSVGLMARPPKRGHRATNADIVAIPALWVDIDIAGGHAAKNLPPTYEDTYGLLPAAFDPSIVVHSGHGIHAYYLFREPLDTRTDEERALATDLLKRLQGAVRTSAAAKGWHVDSTTDLCRVLRVPGTMNRKNGEAVPCVVTEAGESRYTPDDFDILPPVAVTETGTDTTHKFERRDTDGEARLMLDNCAFLHDFTQNYRTLPEPVWKAACTNLMRGLNGEDIILPIVRNWQGAKFDEAKTLKKLQHYLDECQPQTCQHIQQELHFLGCPAGGCGVKSPCGWSLAKNASALAKVRAIMLPSVDDLTPEIVAALNIVKQEFPTDFAKFKERCRGRINQNDLNRIMKRQNAPATLTEGQTLGDVTTGDLTPSASLVLTVPPNFTYGKEGVWEVKQTPNGLTRRLAAGNPVLISRKLYNLDTGLEKISLAFQRHDEQWIYVDLKRSDAFTARNIVEMMGNRGLNVSSESAKCLVRYLQALEAVNTEIPYDHAVSRLGWRQGTDGAEFILPQTTNYIIDIEDDGGLTSGYRQTGSLGEWLSFAREIRQHPAARLMLAASFAAPLLKPLGARNFMLYIWGTSGGAKTAALNFAMSVWGDPARLVRSFYGTTNGLERAAEYSSDFPLAINERQVMAGGGKQDALEQLVYMLEGGKGKTRASKAGLRQTAAWRTVAMGTGEEPISQDGSVQGVRTRLVEINAPQVLPIGLGSSVYGFTPSQHGTAGAEFIKRLLAEGQGISEEHAGLAKKLTEVNPDRLGMHMENIATLAIADFLSSQWLFGLPKEVAAREAWELAVYAAGQMPTRASVADTGRGWQFLLEWLQANLARIDTGNGTKFAPEYGFTDNDCYNIYPSYLKEDMKRLGYRPAKLLKELADQGFICSQQDGGTRRFTIMVKRPIGGRAPVIRIPMSKVNDNEQF